MHARSLMGALLVVSVMALVIPWTSRSQEEASPEPSKPSVDRLNVEDFETQPASSSPKPKPRSSSKRPGKAVSPREDGQQRSGESTPPASGEFQRDIHGSEGPAPGEIWRETVTGLEFVWLPKGCFEMGSPIHEQGRKMNEEPPHEVCVSGLWMGKTEVTVGAFRKFVEATGYRSDAERDGFSWFSRETDWVKLEGASWRRMPWGQGDDHPVINVSWNDATAMADWLSRTTGARFRLPREAEWEYGCRGGTKWARLWGDSPAQACLHGNVADMAHGKTFKDLPIHQCDDGHVHTSPVATYRANGFGLHDMVGNVSEWCEDPYTPVSGMERRRKKPDVVGGGPERVWRGGGWHSPPGLSRCATRSSHAPGFRRSALGFRLVKVD